MEIDKNLKGHALAFTANMMWGLMSVPSKFTGPFFVQFNSTHFP